MADPWQPTSAYPPQPPSGYPPQPPSGYPSQPPSGYPSQPTSGYPSQPPSGYPLPPPSAEKHTGWLVVAWLFLWPIGLYALLSHYLKIDSAVARGDMVAAQNHSRGVKRSGIAALCIGLVAWLLSVVLLIVAAAGAQDANSRRYPPIPGASITPFPTGPAGSTPTTGSAEVGTAGWILAGKVLPLPQGARPWRGGPADGPLDLKAFITYFVADSDQATETQVERDRGFVAAAKRDWRASDGTYTRVVIVQYQTSTGAQSMYRSLTSAWGDDSDGQIFTDAASGGKGWQTSKLDRDGDAYVKMTARHDDIVAYVRHYTAAHPDRAGTESIFHQQLAALNR
jgi:hypothetical protein